MVSTHINAATIGDVNIDYVCDTVGLDEQILTNLDGCLFNDVHSSIGGNGIFFSEAAKKAGFQFSYLISTLGGERGNNMPDLAAEKVLKRLSRTGVVPLFSYDQNNATGKVIILYRPNDKRLMIADRGANSSFLLNNLPSLESILNKIDLLYISGYFFLDAEQRKAVHFLIEKFKEQGTFIFCDVVPHNIFNNVSFDTFTSWTQQCNGIAIEAHTIAGFLNLDKDLQYIKDREKALHCLLKVYEFCLIRLNNKSDFLFANRKEKYSIFIPYIENKESLRFTDRVIAHSLFHYLSNGKNLKRSMKMIDKI